MKNLLKISLLAGIAQTVLSAHSIAGDLHSKDPTVSTKNMALTIKGETLTLRKMLKLDDILPTPSVASTPATSTESDNPAPVPTLDQEPLSPALSNTVIWESIRNFFHSAGITLDFPKFITNTYTFPQCNFPRKTNAINISDIQLQPFSNAPHPYLNKAQRILMENFLSVTTSENIKLERLKNIITLFTNETNESNAKIKNLQDEINASQIESVKRTYTAQKTLEETTKATHLTYCKEMLYHFAIGYYYITEARAAITSHQDLIHLTQVDTRKIADIIVQNKKTITDAEATIAFLKQSIWEMETLMHTLYPYHRSEGAVEYIGNSMASWVTRAVSASYSNASKLRLELTGCASLTATHLSYPPKSIGIAEEQIMIHHADLIEKYQTSLTYMFANSIALHDAVQAKRLNALLSGFLEKRELLATPTNVEEKTSDKEILTATHPAATTIIKQTKR